MFSYNYKELVKNETVSNRFTPKNPDNSQLQLRVDALEPEDSAVYLCASSQDTALQSHNLPVHKPSGSIQEVMGATCPPKP
jgi:hypothetical protein